MTHPPDPTDVLRLRLLLVLGLGSAHFSCGWGTCDEPEYTATVSLDVLADTADSGTSPTDCPTDPNASAELLNQGDAPYCEMMDITFLEQEGSDCTYRYTCFTCCGYGRPYLDERGAPVEADAVPAEGWAEPSRPPVELTSEQRATVGAFWRDMARAEHSSVAGFHRFALDLLAHGAPLELLSRAQRAGAQEVRHAIDAFTLASAYLGEPLGPGRLGIGPHAVVARSLAELAAWTARDGAIGETLAAFLAARALAEATEPTVRAVLETVVRDETEHAELAWATLRWAIEVGGDEVRTAVAAVFAGLGDPTPHSLPWSPELAAHGLPSPEQERADARLCIARVIRPVADALLANEVREATANQCFVTTHADPSLRG